MVYHKGSIVTGSLDGTLVFIDKKHLKITRKVMCKRRDRKGICRILGLRSRDDVLYGLDEHDGLFIFKDDEFHWLFDQRDPIHSTSGILKKQILTFLQNF